MNALDGEPDEGPDEERLAALLVDFETQLAAGNRSTVRPEDPLSATSETDRERLQEAKECVVLLEEIWPHAQALTDELPRAIGRFPIVRELGRGGFSIVYLAVDERLGREIALKVQRPEALISAPLRERFLREAKTAARLRHPHIAGVHEVGEAGLRIWIASEYVAGDSLAAWLRTNPLPVAPRAAATFLAALAEAVEFAHRNGVLHRDLKPGNVLLESTRPNESVPIDLSAGNPKLIDFGLAKLEEAQRLETRSGALIGTPPYMAPEQAAGNVRQIGPATDVYGLGTILYELLTGRAVFGAANDVQTLRQVIEDEPVRPRKLRPGLPADLEAICLKCLEKLPHKRYATAGALAADIERFLAGQPTEARPPRLDERLVKWARRRPALAGLCAVSAAAAIAIVAITATYVARLREAKDEAEVSRAAAVVSAEKSERQEQAATQFLYASQMKLAYQALDQGEIEQVNEILDRYKPGSPSADLRGFEWYHLKRRLHSERLTITAGQGELYAVTFSLDGRQVVSGGQDGTIRFWDAEGGQELKAISAHKSCVNVVVYSPSGTILASASCDHTIKLWDAATLQPLDTLEGHQNEVHCLAFCPTDPKLLAAGGHEPVVRIWDLQTREIVRTFDAGGDVNGLAWRADGKALYAAGGSADPRGYPHSANRTTYVWHMDDEDVESYPWGSYCVAASSRGDVCWGFLNSTIHLGTGKDSQPLVLSGQIGHVDAVAFSPSGDRFASAGADRAIRIWDTATNVLRQVFPGHTARVQSLAFSPQGSSLASASFDGTVKLWSSEPSDRTVQTTDACNMSPLLVAISSDFRYLALQSKVDEVRVQRLDDGASVGVLPLAGY
ncbi:MAG TPA: serine/threonine-protein kinase, partial [Pirellulales bacterium]|nr:serine/threonine-protein kinase [Pirellulales bacterium]